MQPFASGRGREDQWSHRSGLRSVTTGLVLDSCLHPPEMQEWTSAVAGAGLDIEKEPINCKSKDQMSDCSFMTVIYSHY